MTDEQVAQADRRYRRRFQAITVVWAVVAIVQLGNVLFGDGTWFGLASGAAACACSGLAFVAQRRGLPDTRIKSGPTA